MDNIQVRHLYNRFGFGLSEYELRGIDGLSFSQKLQKEVLFQDDINFPKMTIEEYKMMSPEEQMQIKKQGRLRLRTMNIRWLRRMASSPDIIREKINLFWHHHFACEIKRAEQAREFSNHIRKHSLGNFRDLLIGIAQSSAMIDYLNLKRNKKRSPNEDFARELCELFTLGIDSEYTEDDVKEIARAFTGYNYDPDGHFVIRRGQQDRGFKTVFGKRGKFTGEDIIELILEKKACAAFIAENVYRYFVHPIPEKSHVADLADTLYTSGYDLGKMFVHLANADWFYTDKNIGAKIKSPLELLVGLGRSFKVDTENDAHWITIQKLLSQILYIPPNVAGWKEDRQWINPNTLALRMRIPAAFLQGAEVQAELKQELDDPSLDKNQKKYALKAFKSFTHDWDAYIHSNPSENDVEVLLNGKLSKMGSDQLKLTRKQSRKNQVLGILTLPEYQLC